jgi:tRNA(fMet)-specific endonuclease VapC
VILSLDTNVMVDIVNRRRPDVRLRYDEALAKGDEIVTCALAAHELLFGAAISARPEVHYARANELLSDLQVVDLTYEDVLQAIPVRRALRRGGNSIGTWDLMIAGQALHRGWTVISHNLHEYVRVEGLSVETWVSA